MKKIISMILTLMLMMSFGVTVFAEGVGTHTTGVYTSYHPDDISVELEWGTFSFTYYDGLDGRYGEGWVAEEGTNQFYVKNTCTNTALDVSYKFNPVENAEELGLQNIWHEWDYIEWRTAGNRTGICRDSSDILVPEGKSQVAGCPYALTMCMKLYGAPTQPLDNVEIGEITITVAEHE